MINSLSESIYRLSLLNAEQERISYQSSTGKKIDNGSDDSLVFTKEIYIEDKIAVFDGIKKQIDITAAQNKSADSSLAEIKNIISSLKSEIIRALDDGIDPESKKNIAINLEGMKKNLFLFSNEQSNGEYLFSGTEGTKPPFEQDPVTGDVTYVGNGYLKKVAVDEGSYRDRGVTGFDMMMNTNDTAYYGEKLTFTANERVVDNSGNEWVLDAGVPQIVKHTEIGASTETMPLTEILPATVPATYETTNPISTPGQVLKSKENIFDVIDTLVNALNQVDSTGAPITEDQAKAQLKDGLGKVNQAFDSINAAHSALGVRNKIFEVSSEKVSAKITHFNILFRETAGVDLGKVAMEAKALELTFTALYSTVNKMNQLSLVNYIN